MKKVLTVTMGGIRYQASRPADCRHCFFWKNRKKGCVLGKENCYYLIEPPKGLLTSLVTRTEWYIGSGKTSLLGTLPLLGTSLPSFIE